MKLKGHTILVVVAMALMALPQSVYQFKLFLADVRDKANDQFLALATRYDGDASGCDAPIAVEQSIEKVSEIAVACPNALRSVSVPDSRTIASSQHTKPAALSARQESPAEFVAPNKSEESKIDAVDFVRALEVHTGDTELKHVAIEQRKFDSLKLIPQLLSAGSALRAARSEINLNSLVRGVVVSCKVGSFPQVRSISIPGKKSMIEISALPDRPSVLRWIPGKRETGCLLRLTSDEPKS
jgi:hypothetical protein